MKRCPNPVLSIPLLPAPAAVQVIASDARVAVQNDAEGEQFPWDGSSTAGQALLG
jgi:hypothetical protein